MYGLSEHDELAVKHKREWLMFAKRNGAILNRVKASGEHESWLEFIEVETEYSVRTAQKYMAIARDWILLPTGHKFNIDEAYEYIQEYYK